MSETEKNKDDYIVDFIKAFKAVEDEMEPYKEHKRELKKNYIENEWLTKEEISLAVKAYRLMKDDVDIEQLIDFYEHVSKTMKGE